MLFRLFIFIFSFEICANDFFDSGSWFNEEEKFRNGFSFQTIYFKKSSNKNRFIIAKISYNTKKFWEETRINGLIQSTNENQYFLVAETCSIFSTKKLGERWVLLRSVDCDHHKLTLDKKESSFIIDDIFEKNKKIQFIKPIQTNSNLIFVKIIQADEEIFAWGLEVRRVRKNSTASFINQKIILEEIVDSSLKIKKNEFLKKGDIIQIENSTLSLFD